MFYLNTFTQIFIYYNNRHIYTFTLHDYLLTYVSKKINIQTDRKTDGWTDWQLKKAKIRQQYEIYFNSREWNKSYENEN